MQVVGWDKLQHAAAYAVLTILLARAILADGRRLATSLLLCVIFSASFGALIEILQGMMQRGRQADPLDALANLFGTCCGAVFVMLRYWRPASRGRGSGLFLVLSGLSLLTCSSVHAVDLLSLQSDSDRFISMLPPAATRMATFPMNTSAGGPMWTVTALGAVGLGYVYDDDVRRQLQPSRNSTLSHAADAGGLLGNPLLHIGIVSSIYAGGMLAEQDSWRQTAIKAGAALVLTDSVTLVAKETIGRARPDSGDGSKDRFQPFRFNGRNDSLPSLHTASSFALATVLAGETDNPYLAVLYYAGATSVGFARLIQDRHWASDVLLGAAIGGLSGWSIRQGSDSKNINQVAILPMALSDGAGAAIVGTWH